MKELISLISGFFKLIGLTPHAIHYSYVPPLPQIVPDIALKKTHINRELWSSTLGVKNLSGRSFQSIRIKFFCELPYEPSLQSDYPSITSAWEYDKANREIRIKQLDPSESFYIAFFLDDQTQNKFQEPSIGDSAPSRPLIPIELGHPIRLKSATYSD